MGEGQDSAGALDLANRPPKLIQVVLGQVVPPDELEL